MLLRHRRGRSSDHPYKEPSAAKLVLTCPSCQVLLPGYIPFLHPFHRADPTWETHSLGAPLGGTLMGEAGRETAWEGVAWAGQDAAVRRKEGAQAAQRTRAKPSHHFQTLPGSPDRGQAQRRAAEGSRQPRLINLWMSLLAKLGGCCILYWMGPFKGLWFNS